MLYLIGTFRFGTSRIELDEPADWMLRVMQESANFYSLSTTETEKEQYPTSEMTPVILPLEVPSKEPGRQRQLHQKGYQPLRAVSCKEMSWPAVKVREVEGSSTTKLFSSIIDISVVICSIQVTECLTLKATYLTSSMPFPLRLTTILKVPDSLGVPSSLPLACPLNPAGIFLKKNSGCSAPNTRKWMVQYSPTKAVGGIGGERKTSVEATNTNRNTPKSDRYMVYL